MTKKLAGRLAESIGADLFEIKPEIPYTKADLNWQDSKSRSSVEMNDRSSRPAIGSSVDAMNVAYGGIVNSNRIQINIGVRHKTSDNIKKRQAFTVGIADISTLIAADYVGIVSGHDVPDKIDRPCLS